MGKAGKKAAANGAASQTKKSDAADGSSQRASLIPLLGLAAAVNIGAVAVAYWRNNDIASSKQEESPSGPARLDEFLRCGAQCGLLTDGDRKTVQEWMLQAGCGQESAAGSDETTCEASPEQICVTACVHGVFNMKEWLPKTFSTAVLPQRIAEMQVAYRDHLQCTRTCGEDDVTVDTAQPGFAERAHEILSRCGLVQLTGAFEEAESASLFAAVRDGISRLRRQEGRYAALLSKDMLRGGRYQVFLPFIEPFRSRGIIAPDRIGKVLREYFKDIDAGFGIDHISVLSSASGSENQTLHPDVPYYRHQHLSVHTALDDITLDMGPTYFCPCTGEASSDRLANMALRMLVLDLKECLGESYVRSFTPRGTVTIYDGVTFHKGLRNKSDRERHLLKLELGSGDFPAQRDYIKRAPKEAQRQTHLFRAEFGLPDMGMAAIS